jgi:hypothetical protein
MRKTIVTLVDDLDGSDASETVRFALDGVAYEIDLSQANADSLRQALARWLSKARRAGSATGRPRVRRTELPAIGPSRSALIRAWAATNGHQVPARGRIPSAVVSAYNDATA